MNDFFQDLRVFACGSCFFAAAAAQSKPAMGLLPHFARRVFLYGDNVFEKDGIRRDRTGDGEKTRCLCGKRGIFNRDGPAMGPQIIRQLE